MQLENLNTSFLGRNSEYYKQIDSTQSEIWRRYEKNEIPNGTLIMADYQTKGQGTHGRVWHTDEANNIAFSFLIQTNCEIQKLEGITIEIANILIKILKEKYGVRLEVKEPNDIVFKGKKIGGILTQSKVVGNQVKCLVIGIGMNIQQEEFAEEIQTIATSIQKEFGISIKPRELIAEFCNAFEKEIKKKGVFEI
ncbi:MAG: biotin--[acetyl-CoA-carboxylase] ligase [Clostridia bacterium]|nr:biotin--[acetyl-CoA-carboxylase] ligase [Clostridia bacterium]